MWEVTCDVLFNWKLLYHALPAWKRNTPSDEEQRTVVMFWTVVNGHFEDGEGWCFSKINAEVKRIRRSRWLIRLPQNQLTRSWLRPRQKNIDLGIWC